MRSSKRAAAVAALIAVTELREARENRKRKSSPHQKSKRKPSHGHSSRASNTLTATQDVKPGKADSSSGTKSKNASPVKASKNHNVSSNNSSSHQKKAKTEPETPEKTVQVQKTATVVETPQKPTVEDHSLNALNLSSAFTSQFLASALAKLDAPMSSSKLILENQEQLPSLNDSEAIDAFFRRNRRKTYRDLIPEYEQLVGQIKIEPVTDDSSFLSLNGQVPDDHPMKHFVDQSDKEMSVKEALARGFRNYRVRLPKPRRADDMTGQCPSISDLSSLFSNQPPTNYEDALCFNITETTTLNDILTSACQRMKVDEESSSSSPSLPNISETSNISNNNNDDRSSDGDEVSNISLENYPIAPFWKNKVDVSKGYKGGFYIMGIKYIPISSLIEKGAFIVPLQKSIRCLVNESICDITFHQMLSFNGIKISNPNRVDELREIFASSLLVVHHDIVEVLLKASTALTSFGGGQKHLSYEAIRLSKNVPPMACYKPNVFISYLGTSFAGNEIVDLTIPSPEVQKAHHVESGERELSSKEKLYVLTNSDAGISRELICMRYNIKSSTVDRVLANREEVQRMAALVLMEDAKKDESNNFDPASIAEAIVEQQRIMKDGIKKKNRVRRTSFVGLNILMWRFFKDCADNGVPLNGKMLKEHAMIIARQLGLDNFKGSEGWLDAFKRRHKIDLKQMTGSPANYDEEIEDSRMDADEIDDQLEDRDHLTDMGLAGMNADVSSDGMTAALLNCVEKAALPMAVASISNTKPLDLANLFRSQLETNVGTSHNGILNHKSDDQSEDCSLNNVNNNPLPFMQPQPAVSENGIIAAIIKSVALPIPDQELCSAMNTIRSFIVSHDPTAMPLFLELQEKLSVAEKSNR
ncbi:unnamed protein product [Auanema sp. JU1783]|nr:unnamed protein product [Auanema sp. JU1783]